MEKKKPVHRRKKIKHGTIVTAIGGGLGHHLMSDWTIHGVLDDLTHNGILTALLAAVVMTGIEVYKEMT